LCFLPTEDLPRAILHLKLQDICGIGHNMQVRLNQAGITDVAGLWAADGQRLRRIWNGITGLRFHALLHGADLPSPVNPTRSMGH
jgi:DNA polymerase IV